MRRLLAIALLAAPALVQAEVSQSSPTAFLSSNKAEVAAPPAVVFEMLGRVSEWWNGAHTYSGKAENLSLELKAGACFCERWADGSIEHARVLLVQRDRMVRLQGGFGPLQGEGVSAILSFVLVPTGEGTTLHMNYRVRGVDAPLDKLAVPVDKVMSEQFSRLTAALAKR